jgi:hypothetical protein
MSDVWTDADRAIREDVLMGAFATADQVCKVRRRGSLADHCKAILRAAKGASLEPRLYRLVWMVAKWAAATGA